MIQLFIKKGNLFDAIKDPEAIFVHSCNAKCTWNAGIALQFKKRFPRAFTQYCKKLDNNGGKTGVSFIVKEKGVKIGCLIVSTGYGAEKDPEDLIIENTRKAIQHLIDNIKETSIIIHSPLINSGLFFVPWEKTAEIIRNIKTDKDILWLAWDLEAGNLVRS